MSLSYEFSIGSVKAKENSLFTTSDIEHMQSCADEEELIRFLNSKGFDGSTIEEIISNKSDKMWKYLKSIAPDFDIFKPFFIQNDIHNLKVVLKGILSGKDFEGLVLSPNTIEVDALKKAVENNKFSLLPEWISSPAENAYKILAHTGDARKSDAVIDKAAMDKILSFAKKSGSEFMLTYFSTLIFYNNIKIVIRSSRTGASRDFLNCALCPLDGFRTQEIINSALKGHDNLLGTLEKISDYDCNRAIEEYKTSPSLFEKFVDNQLISLTKKICKRSTNGAEPLLGYLIACESEKQIINIIACGLRTKTDKEILRERVREAYA